MRGRDVGHNPVVFACCLYHRVKYLLSPRTWGRIPGYFGRNMLPAQIVPDIAGCYLKNLQINFQL